MFPFVNIVCSVSINPSLLKNFSMSNASKIQIVLLVSLYIIHVLTTIKCSVLELFCIAPICILGQFFIMSGFIFSDTNASNYFASQFHSEFCVIISVWFQYMENKVGIIVEHCILKMMVCFGYVSKYLCSFFFRCLCTSLSLYVFPLSLSLCILHAFCVIHYCFV